MFLGLFIAEVRFLVGFDNAELRTLVQSMASFTAAGAEQFFPISVMLRGETRSLRAGMCGLSSPGTKTNPSSCRRTAPVARRMIDRAMPDSCRLTGFRNRRRKSRDK